MTSSNCIFSNRLALAKEVLAETLFEHMDNGMLVAALADERLSLLYGEDPKLLDPLNPASQVLTDAESEADVTQVPRRDQSLYYGHDA